MLSGKHYIQWLKNLWFVKFLFNEMNVFFCLHSFVTKFCSLYNILCLLGRTNILQYQEQINNSLLGYTEWISRKYSLKDFVYVNTVVKTYFPTLIFPLFCMFYNILWLCCWWIYEKGIRYRFMKVCIIVEVVFVSKLILLEEPIFIEENLICFEKKLLN